MSLPSSPPDPLTLSPSLVAILCLLDQPDILNCKLLNRTICQVIKRYSTVMPRLKVYTALHWIGQEIPYIRLSLTRERRDCFCIITKHRIRICGQKFLSITQFLKENVTELSNEENLPDHELIVPQDEDKHMVIGSLDYESGGLLEGLRLLLSFIFRQYNMEIFRFVDQTGDSMFEKILAMTGDLCKKNRSKCEIIEVLKWNKVEWLAERMGCNHIRCYEESNFVALTMVTRLGFRVTCSATDSKPFPYLQIRELIVKWRSDSWPIKWLAFCRKDTSGFEMERFETTMGDIEGTTIYKENNREFLARIASLDRSADLFVGTFDLFNLIITTDVSWFYRRRTSLIDID